LQALPMVAGEILDFSVMNLVSHRFYLAFCVCHWVASLILLELRAVFW
jgi:hypothetical protein